MQVQKVGEAVQRSVERGQPWQILMSQTIFARVNAPKLQETVAQALTILAVSNEVNQDFIRCAPSACRACSTTGIRCMFMMHFTCAHRWIKTVQPA